MEVRVTRKTIREFVKNGEAQDISHISYEDARKLTNSEGWLDSEMYSSGMYGCNGILFRGHNTGNRYAITDRTQAIYYF